MGSHDISTTSVLSLVVVISSVPSSPVALVAGRELALAPPLRLLVHCFLGHLAQPTYSPAVDHAASRRELRPWWLVHERHELVGEPRHRAADADATDVGTAADAVDPAPLGDVALDD